MTQSVMRKDACGWRFGKEGERGRERRRRRYDDGLEEVAGGESALDGGGGDVDVELERIEHERLVPV
jgi:hypothetical protein